MSRPLCWVPLGVFPLVLSIGCSGPTTTGPTTTQPEKGNDRPVAAKAEFPDGMVLKAGVVDYAQPHDYTFPIHNGGQSPLTLKLVRQSCSCAELHMPNGPIAPGASDKVTIRWAPIPGNSGDYDVVVHVETNDPANQTVELKIHAQIKPLVHVFTADKEDNSFLDFGNDPIQPSQGRIREVKVFSTELPKFKVTPNIPLAGFKIESKPLPSGLRLGNYEVKSGYNLEVRATDALPPGYVNTVLDLALGDLGEQPRTITVPLYAVVGGSAIGVDPEDGLKFTAPHITDGGTAKVHLTFLSGIAQESVEVVSCEPSFIKVDPPVKEPSGKWLITAHLPKDNADAAKYQPVAFMEGKLVLKVAGLSRPLTIRVKWDPS